MSVKNYLRLLVATLTFAIGSLHAQNSRVSGRILDPSESSVSGALVTLTRIETGDHRETVSTAEGYYDFPLLIPGTYSVTAEKAGFEKQTHTGIQVETGEITSVDLSLAIGSITQTVIVDAAIPQLKTESAAVADVVENQTITDMPLLDRRSSQLQRLSGFVVPNGAGSGATVAIAGGRGNNANYLIDGGTAQNVTLGVPALVFDPPVESMQEFNISISNYAAELGRSGGGVIQMTTKSGTNDFRGSLYEYFRNDALNTRTFFAANIPPLRYNLFGATLGGPIVKNKTQFFFNYEGRRQIASGTAVLNVPTAAEDAGNFSADSMIVRDPITQKPFPHNIIPSSRLDAVGSKLALFYPLPNVPGATSGKGNFVANYPSSTVVNDYVARVDHTFSDNNRMFIRFLGEPSHIAISSVFPAAAIDPVGNNQLSHYYNLSGTYYHNFTSTVINEARYTYTNRKLFVTSAGVGSNINQQIGLTGVDPTFAPTVVVNGFQTLGSPTLQQRLQGPIRGDQAADNLTMVRGQHFIKFGLEYRYSSNLDKYSPTAGGAFQFNNVATGSSLASLELGWVTQAGLLATYPLHSRADTYDAFIQDDWRVTPNLTLNYGLRWDIDQPRWETNNRQNSFNPTAINPVSGTPGIITFAGVNGVSKYANHWDLNNFGPRLGFAYKIRDNWVLRGGGALLYLGEYDQATPIVASTGFSTQGNFVSPDNGMTDAFILANGLPPVLSPTPAQLTAGYGAVPIRNKPTTSVSYFNPDRATGYLYQASLDIQHQFAGSLLVDIGYLGTFGHHLAAPDLQSIDQVPTNLLGPGNAQLRRPFPQFSNVQIIAPDVGASKFNGINIGIDKRYSAGLLFKANYTYSKMLDNVDSRDELAAFAGVGAFTNYYNQQNDWGLSGNDIRHRFVVSSIYELPFGRARRYAIPNKALDIAAGGWSAGLIGELRSGTPLSPFMLTNNTVSFSDGERPNVVADPNLDTSRSKGVKLAEWFNVGAFAAPAQYTFGNAGRTFGSGPGAITVDASLLKDFAVVERVTLQFRAEALNLANHPNFANPDTRFGSATFGQITKLVPGNQSRVLQLGLRLRF